MGRRLLAPFDRTIGQLRHTLDELLRRLVASELIRGKERRRAVAAAAAQTRLRGHGLVQPAVDPPRLARLLVDQQLHPRAEVQPAVLAIDRRSHLCRRRRRR